MKIGKRMILDLCYIYILYVFFYGIVIKLTINNTFLFSVKTIVPELLLVAIVLVTVLTGEFRLGRYTFILCFWLLAILLINLTIHGVTPQLLYLIRDIYAPVLVYAVLIGVNFSDDQIEKFLNRMVRLSYIYLISGLLLVIIEQIMGWKWTAEFYTGYSFYRQDPVSKIQIAHNMGLLRAPGWTGNFASFGNYCLICYCMITGVRAKKGAKQITKTGYFFWFVVTLFCTILCTNKSAIVALMLLALYKLSYNQIRATTSLNRIILVTILASVSLLVLGYLLVATDFYKGFFMRFGVWKELLSNVSVGEILFPYNQVLYGTGAEGGLGFWDNTYIYSLFTIGAAGLALFCSSICDTVKVQLRILKKDYVGSLTVILLILAMVANVTQGRGFLTFYLLLISVGCNRFEKHRKLT